MSNTIDRRWLLEWEYTQREFDDATFKDLPDDNAVETIIVDQNNFTRIDFLRSKSLLVLKMNLNKIHRIDVKDNYPNLRELYLIKNNIEVLDLTAADLPSLAYLDVSNNRIKRILTKREALGKAEPTSTSLTHLIIRFNCL